MVVEKADPSAWAGQDFGAFAGGYARWELSEAHSAVRHGSGFGAGALYVPVFVRLLQTGTATPVAVVQALLALNDSDAGEAGRDAESAGQTLPRFLDAHEADSLQTELDRAPAGATHLPHEIRCIVWCPPERTGQGDLWQVLHVGPPVALARPPRTAPTPRPHHARQAKASPSQPIVAVIDDGIGFLNARFRRAPLATRFRAVWLQASQVLTPVSGPGPDVQVTSGLVLAEREINAILHRNESEAHAYQALNARLFPADTHRSTAHRIGHGTHVLDLAAGAPIGSPMSAVPLLAVQLPPAAIGETSGRRLDPHIVQGLRWVVAQALQAVREPGQTGGVPLVVNISLGSLGGPQDGTGFLEDWIDHEIARFGRLSGNTPIRIVAAYGNAWRARLVARRALAPGESTSLDWRIQADDATPSFVELRVPKGTGAGMRLTLEPPTAARPAITLHGWLAPGAERVLPGAAGNVAAIYGVAEAHFDLMLIAVGATQRHDGRTTAPPGPWRLTLVNTSGGTADVGVRVQRDDTPPGYRRRGRQSWLDHPEGWVWDSETQDWTAPGPDCPVTRRDTAAAFSGLKDRSFYLVGAARNLPGAPDMPQAARYTSEAADAPRAPTLAALADAGAILTGRRAAGVVSGSSARMSGTSVAAPQVTRRLVGLLGGGAADNRPEGNGPGGAEISALLALPVGAPLPAAPDSRLGFGVVPVSDPFGERVFP